jgi:CRP/FNR family transcriptional regulator, cyclic AMP receptor protein
MKLPQIFSNPTNIRAYSKDAVIFQKGDEALEMFVVQSGEVDICIGGSVVETIGPDGFFGEMSIIDDTVRSADATAKTDCTLLPVNRHHFLFMVDETPLFAIHVMRGMAERLRKAAKRAVE